MVTRRLRRHQEAHVDELAKEVAQVALRLAALPASGLRGDAQALDEIERLAMRILNEVSVARRGRVRDAGETSGTWRAMQPMQR